jgi:alpha-L-fucosidase
MYVENTEQYRYHWRVYGHPSQFGYKDIVALWKAEKFDPDGLMTLFVEAGAKYFLGQAMHHDNFDNFDSKHQPWNSVRVGPKQNICALWKAAAKAHNLPFGLSEHLGASFNWFGSNKGADKTGPYAGVTYDGADPKFAELYYNNQGYSLDNGWYTENAAFQNHWFDRIKDVIDQLQPDLLYSDGGVPYGEIGLSIVAHLYNTSIAVNGVNNAVYNQKDTDPQIYTIGVLDIERGQLSDIAEHPWQTDTSVGDWYYNVKDVYKTPRQVLETLIDIVSKNGNLVLNITQRPDGTIDDECEYLLKRMAVWMKSQDEGIFRSRPWSVAGEGPSQAEAGAFKEAAVEWTASDFRFTAKGDTVYAYQMRPSDDGIAEIASLSLGKARRVSSVRLLGAGALDFKQTDEKLSVSGVAKPAIDAPVGLAVQFD